MNIKYCFRDANRFSKLDPKLAASELARICNENGLLTPVAVLDAARDENNPLHPAFEWDDSKAAEIYRRSQAQDLIYSVEIVREDFQPEPVYFHSQSAGGYMPMQEVVRRVDLLAEARQKAHARLLDAKASLLRLEMIAMRENMDLSLQIKNIANVVDNAQKQLQEIV